MITAGVDPSLHLEYKHCHVKQYLKEGRGLRNETALDTVPRQLAHQPTNAARNRKPLEANPLAPWELRIGDLRVYFEVGEEPARVVKIVAIGRKERERVLIGGVEVKLR